MGLGDIFKIGQFKAEIEQLKSANQQLHNDNCAMHQQLQDLGALDYYQIKNMTQQLENEYSKKEIRLKEEYDKQERISKETLQKRIDSLEQTANDRDNKCQEILEHLNELRIQEAK